MRPQTKKRWFNILRVAICIAALWFVVQGVTYYDRVVLANDSEAIVGVIRDAGDPIVIETLDGTIRTLPRSSAAADDEQYPLIRYGLRTTWMQSRKWFLVLAVLLQFPVLFPQAYRFRIMLSAQGIRMGYMECLKLSLAGNFLNFAAPLGSNAGDVFKAYFAALHAPTRKPEAVATVILDRAIGLGSLVFVVVLITLFAPGDTRLSELRPYMLGMFGAGVAAVALYFSPLFRRWLIPARIVNRLPMRDKLVRLDGAAQTLLRKPGTVVIAVLLTIFLQALAMLAYFAVAVGVGLDAGWRTLPEFFAYFYTGTVVQALPGPPQGLGTVELTYRYFFAPYGSPAQIVSMALAIRLVVLVCALPGLWIMLTGTYRPKDIARLAEELAENTDASPADVAASRPTALRRVDGADRPSAAASTSTP